MLCCFEEVKKNEEGTRTDGCQEIPILGTPPPVGYSWKPPPLEHEEAFSVYFSYPTLSRSYLPIPRAVFPIDSYAFHCFHCTFTQILQATYPVGYVTAKFDSMLSYHKNPKKYVVKTTKQNFWQLHKKFPQKTKVFRKSRYFFNAGAQYAEKTRGRLPRFRPPCFSNEERLIFDLIDFFVAIFLSCLTKRAFRVIF
jgi:hypothetical protein